jgi:prepilin-type N-terminal cleavage/methylation domain-containing protein
MKSEKGFSLIEVGIAIALLGIVAIALLTALATGSKALFVADERATAESLARAELEYVRNQDYKGAPWDYELPSNPPPPSWLWESRTLPDGYDTYTVGVSAEPLHASDAGIQRIIVTVWHLGKPDAIVTLENYRSLR